MKAFYLISFLLLGLLPQAQPIAKLYVFAQEFTPGMIPEGNEDGSSGNRTRTRTQYHIYLTQVKGQKLSFDRIRIDTQWYKISSIDTVKAPVYSEEPEKKLLVPASSNLVLQLHLGEKCSGPGSQESAKFQARLYYRYKGKKLSYGVGRIERLPSVLGI